MRRDSSISRRALALCLIAAVALLATSRAEARIARANLANMAAASAAIASPGSCATGPCCAQPCIRYIDRSCGKPCCGKCEPPVKTVLTVVNPVTCCTVEVPVCLPACCDGCPTVCSRRGILCRGVVTYDWCCGYRVVMRFDRCGDVTVVYRG